MPQCFVRIKSRPAGGAPIEIRDKWIGLILPVLDMSNNLLADVMTGKLVTDRVGGYAIRWDDAMNVLEQKHPEARKWWEENVERLRFPTLIFDPDCCEVVAD
ncbi:MAG: hypothetical protein HY507_00285 [Candidatus Zambryskibacteria bacterium]|nr:hypothetical protein [Candidatus Zambryskibacteria bacterium]